jgi:hypothetical protein
VLGLAVTFILCKCYWADRGPELDLYSMGVLVTLANRGCGETGTGDAQPSPPP